VTTTTFRFKDAIRLTCPVGETAATLREFRGAVERVPAAVLHHHLRETPLRFAFGVWDYPNDFALWAADALENRALAERFAVLDPFHECDLELLRERILDAVDDALGELSSQFPVPPGQEFYFASSVAVKFDLDITAGDLEELASALERVPASSIYYHFYEARLRTDACSDDLSSWLAINGLEEEAKRLNDLDIYMLSLEDCRRVALELLRGEGA
jgi:hypothetical protein